MRAFLIVSLATIIMSQAFAQEEAPLELGRPTTTPIKIKRTPPPPPPTLDPPPTEAAKPKKVRKVVTKKAAAPPAAAATTAPATPAATAPVTPTTTTPAATATATAAPVAPVAPATPTAAPVATTPEVVMPPPTEPLAPPVKAPRKKSAITGQSTVRTEADKNFRKRALLNFRFANIWAIRNRTNTGSFILSWDPVIYPWKRFNFGATLGVTQFESENVAGLSADSFLVYEYGASVSYYVSRIFLPELVIGQQMWNEASGSTSNLLVAFNGNLLFRKRPFGYLDRAYVGLGSLQMNGGSTNIFRAGIGVRF